MITLTEGDDVLVELILGDVTINALDGDDRVVITNQDMGDDGSFEDYGTVTVYAGTGDDEVDVYYAAYAELYGEDGDDELFIRYYSGEAHGGPGNDTIDAFAGSEATVIYGDDGNDTLFYGSASYGGEGDDRIIDSYHGFGGNGSDYAWGPGSSDGGAGDDNVWGEGASGGDGSDVVRGDYNVDGGPGNDVIFGGFSQPEAEEFGAIGGSGRDVFFPFAGMRQDDDGEFYIQFTVADFEPGVDAIAFTEQLQVVSAFTGQANQVVSTATESSFDFNGDGVADHTSTNYRHLTQDNFVTTILVSTLSPYSDDMIDQVATGTSPNEFAYGSGGDDELVGNGGDDVLHGGFGKDSLSGNSGDDLLVGNAGMDRLYGGSGNDELDGGDGDDTLSASAGDDYAYGGAGNDLAAGGEGDDRLLGEIGDDRLNGGAGNDVLDGGNGRDTLIGGAGKDIMIGGAGPDQFLFMPSDSRPGGSLRDVITDFTSGEDKLDLRALGITDMAAQVSTQTIGSGMILRVDLDGDGFDYADFAVRLSGLWSLAASDLLI